MQVPTYISDPLPGSHLVIDNNGLPVYQGNIDVSFTVSCERLTEVVVCDS